MRALVLGIWFVLAAQAQLQALKGLCLQEHDVPKGFVQSLSRPVSNADISKSIGIGSRSIARQFGRVGGYETAFLRKPYRRELFSIRDVVSRFQSAGAAAKWDALLARSQPHGTWLGASFRRVPGVVVGDAAVAFSATGREHGYSYTAMAIFFRRAALTGDLFTEGFAGSFTTAQVVALARTIDARFMAGVSLGLKSGRGGCDISLPFRHAF